VIDKPPQLRGGPRLHARRRLRGRVRVVGRVASQLLLPHGVP
jgi:hypothetical protein